MFKAPAEGQSSTITRKDGGSWITDGFKVGDTIVVSGTRFNDGKYVIKEISDNGRVLVLSDGVVLRDEIISKENKQSTINELSGNFTLKKVTETVSGQERTKIVLQRTDSIDWSELKLRLGDYVLFDPTGENGDVLRCEVIEINGDKLTLNISGFDTEELDENLNFNKVKLELLPIEYVIIRADGDKGQDKLTYIGDKKWSDFTNNGKKIEVGDYITVITPGAGSNMYGPNSGVYEIIGFSEDGKTAILGTSGLVQNEAISGTKVSKSIPSEITRDEGDWSADGFAPGQLIYIDGAKNEANNGYFYVLDIINYGKTLRLYRGQELVDEDILSSDPDRKISIGTNYSDSIIRDSGSWTEDGFVPGQKIRIFGSKNGNDGVYTISEISADGKILVLDIDGALTWEETSDLIIMLVDELKSNITVNAQVKLPESGKTAKAKAEGISGGTMLSGSGVWATTEVSPVVQAYIGKYSNLQVDGKIELLADVKSQQEAYTGTINISIAGLAVSANFAFATANSQITANIGDYSKVMAYQLFIKATGKEATYAEAESGSGGVISGKAIMAQTDNHSNTIASVDGVQIEVYGFDLLAEHTAIYNSKVNTINAAVLGGSAGVTNNQVNAVLKAQIGANAKINAYDILIRAQNYTLKDWLSDGYNVYSGSGGGLDIPAAASVTEINQETIIEVLDHASLNLISEPLMYPGNLNLTAFNFLLARDKIKLDSLSAITSAAALSKITAADIVKVIIGQHTSLNSQKDINISAHSQVETDSQVDINVIGAATGAGSEATAKVSNENSITVMPYAVLYAEGTINLLAGKNISDFENNIKVNVNSVIVNRGVIPFTDPVAEGYINLKNYITIEENASLKSVGDINLITESGVLLAEADVSGTDWVKSVFGAEIIGGTGKFNIDSVIRIDGTVLTGMRSQQKLVIDENGNIVQDESTEGLTISYKKEILYNYILEEIKTLSKLSAEYAGSEAGEAFKAQINSLKRELELMGYNAEGPLDPVWIDVIVIGDIHAEQSNINIVSENGSLVGKGTLNAADKPALIQVINNSPYYLVLGTMTIPEKQGGLVYFNNTRITGTLSEANAKINELNKDKGANFKEINSGRAEGAEVPKIIVQNTYQSTAGRNPDIRISGSIKNIGYQGNPGYVEIKSTGNISIYGSIEAGDLKIEANGNLTQSYTESFFNVGGSPRAIWGGFASTYTQGRKTSYPYRLVFKFDLSNPFNIGFVWERETTYDDIIQNILNNPPTNQIKADNIFIAARYLNINGTIEAGRSEYNITFGSEVESRIDAYKKAGIRSQNYKDYPLYYGEVGYFYYYDPVANAIVLEPIAVRGGYIELFGHIISTGNGTIKALDGYGTINVQNDTDYDLIIKGLDTGIGSKGVVIITDTSKKKPGYDNVYMTTKYERVGNQVKITTWYTDDKGNIVEESTVNQDEAKYMPTEGWRFDWVMGQSISEMRIETYCSKSWLGMDWIARDPDDLIEEKYEPIGQPRLLPEGEYLRYSTDPKELDEPYIYKYEYRVLNDIYWNEPKASEHWTEQSWFLAPKYYYSRYYFERGSMEVYYHSIKADYPISIKFTGSSKGTITINSKGSIIIDGAIKNEKGSTTVTTQKGIYYRTGSPIASNTINMMAGTGIGVNAPVLVELYGNGRAVDAYTATGNINIKEIDDALYVGNIISDNGNIRLEAQTKIIGIDGNSLIKGRMIELFTLYGAIGSDALPLKIDSGEGAGQGVSAQASGDIYLQESAGTLQVINITSQNGNLYIRVPGGSLVDGNPDNYQGNGDLLGLWNNWIKEENTAQEIYEFLETVRVKLLSNTNYWSNDLDLAGEYISLDVASNIGATEQFRIDLVDGKVRLTEEMRTILAAAKPGEIAFYDSNNNRITDPSQLGNQIAYVLVNIYRPITVQAKDRLKVEAGGHIFLNSKENINLETVKSTTGKTIMLKSAKGIYNASIAGANIIGGDLVLEAAAGPLGAEYAPLLLQLNSDSAIVARSGSEIYLRSIQSNGSNGGLNIDFIYAPGLVNLVADSVQAATDGEDANIITHTLVLTASSMGNADNFLRIDLLNDGSLRATADGNIYLWEVAGNMNIDAVTSDSGDIYLKAQDSIYSCTESSNPNVKGKGLIQLKAINGEIGAASNFLKIYTLPGGRLSATAKGNIYIKGIDGDLYLGTLTSQSEDGIVYIFSPYNILNGNPVLDGVNIISNKAHIDAEGNIGSVDNYLKTAVDYLEGTSGGDIRIFNTKDLTVGAVDKTIGLSSGGLLHLIVTGKLAVVENIISQGDIILTTEDLAAEGQDIVINEGIAVESQTSSLELQAGDNILLNIGAILRAQTEVGLKIDYKDSGAVDADPGVGGYLGLLGSIQAPSLLITGQADDDEFLIKIETSLPNTRIEIYGNAGNDTFNLYSYKAKLTINGNEGNDYFNLKFDELAKGDVTLNGNSGDDYYNLEFSPEYFEYVILNGDEGDDIFSFADGIVLNGKINGGTGLDTLDYSRYITARYVTILGWDDTGYYGIQKGTSDKGTLTGPLCTITDGFTGIRRVIGSLTAKEIDGDKLYSIQDESGKWILDGNNSIYQALAAVDSDGNAITLNFVNYDFLYGSDKDDSFTITGQEYGRLYGGPGNDTFVMLDGASLYGDIDGGGGNNTLDYRDYTKGIYVNLSEFKATNISNSVAGIQNVFGGLGDDIIIGDNGDNILGSNGGNDILQGVLGNNIYLFFDGFDIVEIIETSFGKDILDFSNVTVDLRFELADGKVVSGDSIVSYNGNNIEAYIGGHGDDIFIFADGFRLPSGTYIDGRQGYDTIDLSAYESSTDVTLTAAETNGFSGKGTVIPGGFKGIDRIIGSSTSENTLRGMDADSTYTFEDSIHSVRVGSITLAFENYGHIIGGAGDDTFAFVGDGSLTGSIDGGLGTNWLDYTAYGSGQGVTVSLEKAIIPGLTGTLKQVYNIIGTPYDDDLTGDNRDNIIIGGEGNDILTGLGGNNTYVFENGWGVDQIINSSGKGILDFSRVTEGLTIDLDDSSAITSGVNKVGFSGISSIVAGSGDNTYIISGTHNTDITGGSGNDIFKFIGKGVLRGIIDGGLGENTLDYSEYDTAVLFNLEAMNATGLAGFKNIKNLKGSKYSDTITESNSGSRFNITGENAGNVNGQIYFASIENLNGGSGDDTFAFVGTGRLSGSINGGSGSNWLDYSGYGRGVTVNLTAGQIEGLGGSLTSVNNILGSPYDDILIGSMANNILNGGAGNDIIKGTGGNNTIIGGEGDDKLYGGRGSDTFIFEGNFGADNLYDYEDGETKGLGSYTLDFSNIIANLTINIGENAGQSTLKIMDGVDGNSLSYSSSFPKVLKAIYSGKGNDTFNLNVNRAVSLYGGGGDDTYCLTDGVIYGGLIDGGDGNNTIDFSKYNTSRDVILTGYGDITGFRGTEKSLTSGFINISSIIGSSGSGDSLKGLDAPSTFVIDGNDRYISGGRTLGFRGFETLIGGSGNDTFEVKGEQTYDLFGGDGDDTFTFFDKAKLNGIVDGGRGSNTLNLSGCSVDITVTLTGLGDITGFAGNIGNIVEVFKNITAIVGGSGSDTLRGMDSPSTFILDGNDRYTNGGRTLSFSGFETLIGGSGNDRFEIAGERGYHLKGGDGNDVFVFLNNGKLKGTIDGGSGSNTLDYSSYPTAISIILTGVDDGSFAGRVEDTLEGFTNFQSFIGSRTSGDSLKGMDEVSTWELNGSSVLYRDILLSIADIEILIGGSKGDIFKISGTVPYSLRGGAGDDNFIIMDKARLNGSIEGGAGKDTLDFSDYLSQRRVYLTGAGANGFSGYETAVAGGFKDINIVVGSQTQADILTGINDKATFILDTIVRYVNNMQELIIRNFENLVGGDDDDTFQIIGEQNYNLSGGAGNDVFKFIGSGFLSGTIDGGSGTNTLDYSGYGSGVEVNLMAGSGTGVAGSIRNISNLTGSKHDDILTGDNRDNIIIGGEGNDILTGLGGNNTYVFENGWGVDQIINSSGKGTLDFSRVTEGLTIDLDDSSTITSGANKVGFSGISSIVAGSGDNTYIISGTHNTDITGGSGNDIFKFIGKGVLRGIIDGGLGENTLDYSEYDTAVLFNLEAMNATGLAGFKNIKNLKGGKYGDTITGSNSGSRFNITGENAGNVNGQIYFASIENLNGGSGDDTFAFVGAGHITGSIDGGGGSNTLDYGKYDIGNGSGAVVDLNKGSATAVAGGAEGMINRIQNLVSSSFDDVFTGHESENNSFIFEDGWGHDTINPGGGHNILDLSRITVSLITNLGCTEVSEEEEIIKRYIIEVKHLDGENIMDDILVSYDKHNDIIEKIYGGQGGNKFYLNADYAVSLYGGSGDDTFHFADNTVLNGLIDGGGGRNTLDFSAYSTSRDIILKELGKISGFNGTVNGITGGFYNIDILLGSSASGDSLTGLNEDAAFILKDTWHKYLNQNTGCILSFIGFEVLKGGSRDDIFEIYGQQHYELFGGAGNDRFIFADNARLYGSIDGQSGNNTLDYTDYTTARNFYLTDKGDASGFNGREASITGEFKNINNLLGGKAIDSLSGLNLSSTWEISGQNKGHYKTDNIILTFDFIDNLNGGVLDDNFIFQDGASLSGHIDGRSGIDTLDYSAYLQGILVNLTTGVSTGIIRGISSIENVTGGKGDDILIGDNKDNILDGGPGDDYIDGRGGDDTLITGSGYNTIIGGDGRDKAIVAYGSTYQNPGDDIEVWVFLQPPVNPPGPSEGGGGAAPPPAEISQHIDSSTGGTIFFEGGSIEIPANVLPGDATITVKKLTQEEVADILSDDAGLILGNYVYEINTSGDTYFGEDNYITITFTFDPAELPLGQRPVVRYYDEEQGKWIEIETDIEYDEETGEWKAVIKVNHLTKFAVFSAPWRPYLKDRYLTAVANSQSGWQTSEYAVLVRGDDFADALSAGPLAYKYGCPVLLTQPEEISKDTLNELRRLGVKHLFIVGGPSAVSTNVEETVKAVGITIERIYGSDRYETAVKVAEKVGHNGSLFLTVGNDFPDALSASAIASRLGMPILLTYKDALPQCVAKYLEANPVDVTYVLGGTGVISAEVENSLTNPVRLAGKDRYETNIAVLKHFAEDLDWDNVYVTAGNEFPDGLTGGVLAAQTSSPLVLADDTLDDAVKEYLKTMLMDTEKIIPLGGEAAVPDSVLTEIYSLK